MKNLLVQDLMKTDLIMVDPSATLKEGFSLMKENNIKSIVVNKGRDGDAYGLLQYIDIAKEIIANEGDIDLLNVYDVASKPVIQVSKELEAKYVVKLMMNYDTRRLLVVDNNQVEGIISLTDVISIVIDQSLEEE